MPAKIRALFAALILTIVALIGALYLGFERGYQQAQLNVTSNGVANLDLRSLLASGSPDDRLLNFAFRRVEEAFYKPVMAQTLLSGEHEGLLAFLRYRTVHNPVLPPIYATGDQTRDEQRLRDQLLAAQNRYGGLVGKAELTQAAIRGMMNALNDPYTTYLSPHDIQGLQESLSGGNFGGIGVYIVQELKTNQIIVTPIESMPAARVGVKPGDVVLSVDGKTTKGLKLDEVERLIRGPAGTVVHLVTHPLKSTHERSYAIMRQVIHVPSVKAKMEDGFEYVRLFDFGDTSAEEVRHALLDGKAHGAKGYILDLRDNGGGLLEAAVAISSLFIPSGTIVSTIDRAGMRDTQQAHGRTIGATPLVVLVNKYTASASEITSGAIQDYKVGTLIGTKTFGKGVVQSIYNLPDASALKITTAKYVTPLGRDIQHKGIAPDVAVPQSTDPILMDTPKDAQLAAAKAHLRRLAHR
ncbi:MAG: S41 family peptidase [Candidatus Eremiobacteraeota bacterium]|nr:S41 family peptidase [Candidatus Eremiobacteraeota bacterium]